MEAFASFFDRYGALLAQGTVDTLVMTLVSTLFAYVIGIPLGVALVVTAPAAQAESGGQRGARMDRQHRPIHPVHHPADVGNAGVACHHGHGHLRPRRYRSAGIRCGAVLHPSGGECACRAGRRSDRSGTLDGLHAAGDHLPRIPEES